jgi:hypothetical protein
MTLVAATQIVTVLVAGCAALMVFLYRDRLGLKGNRKIRDTESDSDLEALIEMMDALTLTIKHVENVIIYENRGRSELHAVKDKVTQKIESLRGDLETIARG